MNKLDVLTASLTLPDPPKDSNLRRYYSAKGRLLVMLFDGDTQLGAIHPGYFTKVELEAMPIYTGEVR